MMPESNFIRTHVAESVKNTYKVQIGTETTLEVRYKKVLFVNVPYVVTVTTPVYETIVNYTDKLKIDDNLPIGYIVGVNSNSLAMGLDEATEANVRIGIAAASTVMKIAQGINLVKYCGSLGLLSSHKTYATYCENAANWLDNFDGELNELKGSSENDGLVAKESQYYPMSAHSLVLGDESDCYVSMKYNHAAIDPTTNTDVQDKISDMLNSLERK